MEAFEVKVVTGYHSLCQTPYYSCLCRTKETAEAYFKTAKEQIMSKINKWWHVYMDGVDEFAAEYCGHRDYFHLFFQGVETDDDFVEGEWRKGYLGEEEKEEV